MRKWLPNILTLGNLLCGILAILSILIFHSFDKAFLFILLGLVFDFLDGFVARMLKVSGELGKQLDSLADMVSFGVAPGLVMLVFLNEPAIQSESAVFQLNISDFYNLGETAKSYFSLKITYLSLVALLIPLFSAVRLAKFNIDTRQSEHFLGLPTPANALFWTSIPLMSFVFSDWAMAIGIVVFSFLMVSEIPLFSLKVKDFTYKNNNVRVLFLLLTVVLLIYSIFIAHDAFAAFPIIIILYLLLSFVNNIIKKNAVQSRN